jgi:hypothetical protein
VSEASQLSASEHVGRNPEFEAIVRSLKAMSRQDYDAEVRHWALDPKPDPKDDQIFRHPALLPRTRMAMQRLLKEAKGGEAAVAQKTAEKLHAHAIRLGMQRQEAGARRTTLRAGRPGDRVVKVDEIKLPSLQDMPTEAAKRLEQLVLLVKHDMGTFEDAVFLWATSPGVTWEEDMVFQSAELATATSDALRRLQRDNRAQEAEATSREEQALLRIDGRMLGEARNALKPFVNLARANRARSDAETAALDMLRRVYYPDYRAILADVKAKKPKREVERLARERRDAQLHPAGESVPAKPRRRKRKRTRKHG